MRYATDVSTKLGVRGVGDPRNQVCWVLETPEVRCAGCGGPPNLGVRSVGDPRS